MERAGKGQARARNASDTESRKEETTQCYRKYVLCNQSHIKNALLIKGVKCSKEISNRNVYGVWLRNPAKASGLSRKRNG